jgi:CRP-like cAMP-binding protein
MPKAPKSTFDPKVFLAKVGDGKAILKFDKSQIVFSQGDAADTVFYIQKGKIKVLVSPSRARKRWSESWSPDNSSAKVA